MIRLRSLLAGAAFAAVSALAFSLPLAAEDAAPKAPVASPAPDAPAAPAAPTAPAASAETPKPAEAPKPDTKTPSPIHSMMGWVAKQVAPNLECGCPATSDGETAWRAWFAGGKDVPLAGLRDAMVADGWTADKTVGFFREMVAKKSASGDCASKCDKAGAACAKGDGEGCCQGKGERADGKPCCGSCKKKDAAAKPAEKPADAPTEAPKLP
jgi:hypothetical protein